MSVSWGSRLPAALAAVAALTLAFGAADARARVHVSVRDDSGRAVERIRITPQGVTFTSPGGRDSTVLVDTLGHGAIVIDDGNGVVRFLSDARIAAGERIDGDVVAILGNVHVSGAVTGSAVAIFGHVDVDRGGSVGGDAVAVFGNQHSAGDVSGSQVAVLGGLDLAPGASVGGDAVAVGGHVVDHEGSRIAGQSVSVSMLPLTLGLPALPVVLALVALGWIVTVFFGWLFGVLFPDRLARVATTASRHTFLSIVVSALSLFLWPMLAILLMATIVGLPIGILLWLVYPVLVYAGQLAATYVLGCKLLRRRLGEGRPLAPIMAGSLLIAGFFAAAVVSYSVGGAGGALALFLGLLAVLVLLGLTAIGTGAFLISRGGSRSRDERPAAAAPAPPPAAEPGPVTG